MIIERDPENWQDLQKFTAKVFFEMGCKPEVEKTIKTVRGSVEIDVYVLDPAHTPPLILICECKYWSKRIPKHVVHSIRTVAADCGANRVYLISKEGFQKGAIEAADNSNVVLVNWLDFQKIFYSRWVQSMTKKLYKYADIIFEYMDVFNDRMGKVDWTEENKNLHASLMLRSSIYIYANRWVRSGESIISFPMKTRNPKTQGGEEIILRNYREYFDMAFSAAPSLIAEWEELFGK